MSRATSYREGGMPIWSFVRWPQGIRESFSRAAKRTISATSPAEAGLATAEGVSSSTSQLPREKLPKSSASWLGDGRGRQFVDDVFGAHGRIGGDVGNADGGFETGGEVGHSASHGTTAARRGRQLKPGQARRLFEE